MTINVLSVFDGISCARIALERAKIPINNYYASEIDKFAMRVSKNNYPDIIQLGDIKDWEKWNLPQIDLLIGGSPCVGFSQAGKRLNFNDPKSKLFFIFVDILKAIKPKYFLLENVKMQQKWVNLINELLYTKPIEINSSLVSAQNRKRLYWTNIKNIKIPEDKGILLKNIVIDNHRDLMHTKKGIEYMNRITNSGKRSHWEFKHYSDILKDKSSVVVSNFHKGVPYNVLKDYDGIRKFSPLECERLQTIPDNYTDIVSNTQRYILIGNAFTVDVISHILKFMEFDINLPLTKQEL